MEDETASLRDFRAERESGDAREWRQSNRDGRLPLPTEGGRARINASRARSEDASAPAILGETQNFSQVVTQNWVHGDQGECDLGGHRSLSPKGGDACVDTRRARAVLGANASSRDLRPQRDAPPTWQRRRSIGDDRLPLPARGDCTRINAARARGDASCENANSRVFRGEIAYTATAEEHQSIRGDRLPPPACAREARDNTSRARSDASRANTSLCVFSGNFHARATREWYQSIGEDRAVLPSARRVVRDDAARARGDASCEKSNLRVFGAENDAHELRERRHSIGDGRVPLRSFLRDARDDAARARLGGPHFHTEECMGNASLRDFHSENDARTPRKWRQSIRDGDLPHPTIQHEPGGKIWRESGGLPNSANLEISNLCPKSTENDSKVSRDRYTSVPHQLCLDSSPDEMRLEQEGEGEGEERGRKGGVNRGDERDPNHITFPQTPINPYTFSSTSAPVLGGISMVGQAFQQWSLEEVDFPPEGVAPTTSQHLSLDSIHCLLSKRGGDEVEEVEAINPDLDWIVDGGCTKHMARNKDSFIEFKKYTGAVKTVSGVDAPILGIGRVRLQLVVEGEKESCVLEDVLYVPSCPYNLISQSTVEKRGCYINTKFGFQIRVKEDDRLVMEATTTGGLYVVNQWKEIGMTAQERALLAKVDLQTWHERLGHINVDRLKKLKDGMAGGVSFSEEELKDFSCEVCALGKAHKAPIFNHQRERASHPGQLFHADVCGPMKTESKGGATYLMLAVDDASRKVFSYFLKKKSDCLEAVQQLVEEANTKFYGQHKVEQFHSDNGGEFVGEKVEKYLKSQGIKHTTSAPHTPQHNGVAERMIRSIVAMARCMLLNSDLSQRF